MSEWIKKINWKYVIVMLIGNVILGLGIAIFKLSGLGNDPFSGMVMALSDRTGILSGISDHCQYDRVCI